jgi:hypothetical protein
MPRCQHHRDGPAMGVSGDISLINTNGLHPACNPVCDCLKTGVEAGNPIRLTHVQHVNGVHRSDISEMADVQAPILRRTDQAVDEEQRSAGPGALEVHTGTIHLNKGVFDPTICPTH